MTPGRGFDRQFRQENLHRCSLQNALRMTHRSFLSAVQKRLRETMLELQHRGALDQRCHPHTHNLDSALSRNWDNYLSEFGDDSWTRLRQTVQTRKFAPLFLAGSRPRDSGPRQSSSKRDEKQPDGKPSLHAQYLHLGRSPWPPKLGQLSERVRR
jgi:hypothetical protein